MTRFRDTLIFATLVSIIQLTLLVSISCTSVTFRTRIHEHYHQIQPAQQLTLQKQRNGRDYRHVVHLDSVIDSEEEEPTRSELEDFVSKHDAIFGTDKDDESGTFDNSLYFDDAIVKPASEPCDSDDGYNDDVGGFYDMVLNILDTFHSAAKTDVQQARKRDYHRYI